MIKKSLLAVFALSSAMAMASPALAACGEGLLSGTVKFFNTEKGFGAIMSDDNVLYHVHHSGLIDRIRENNRVCFDVEHTKKGQNAVYVKLQN